MSPIGSHRRCALAVFQKLGLAPFRGILPPDIFEEAASQAHCAPRREHPLIPESGARRIDVQGRPCVSADR